MRVIGCANASSLSWGVSKVIYVDSGSSDDSVAMAQSLGVAVVELDMTRPFTAARARNEGFRCLRKEAPELNYVQFVDGDCEVVPGWLEKATLFLNEHSDVAAVCGRRRERFPDRSMYNMLCDMEWDTPVGEAKYCGGDAMMRASVLESVGGYREDMIAGEEPELCVRLRSAGWKIWRLGEEMTLHDAAMTRFGSGGNGTSVPDMPMPMVRICTVHSRSGTALDNHEVHGYGAWVFLF